MGDLVPTSSSLPADLRPEYDRLLRQLRSMDDPQYYSGSFINPYNGKRICTPDDLDLYFQLRALSLCYQGYLADSEKRLIDLERSASSQLASLRFDLVAASDKRRVWRLISIVLVVLVLFLSCIFIPSQKSDFTQRLASVESGYTASIESMKADYEQQISESYDDGYATGYNKGFSSCNSIYSQSSESSGSSSSGISMSDVLAHASAPSYTVPPAAPSAQYIGNRNTHKFHFPTCSYLPASQNRVYFDSRSAAVAAGYDSCGRCHP